MINEFEGKVALVTGAAGSIGSTTVDRLVGAGAQVAMVDISGDALSAVAARLGPDAQKRVICIPADVGDVDQSAAYVAQTVNQFGRLDMLFSNAGNDGPILPVQNYPIDMFDLIQRTHVRGTFLALKNAIPHMPDNSRIVITASVVGLQGVPGNCAYVAAKHALIGLVRGSAKELASRGITVNAVCPGPVENEFMHAAERSMSEMLGHDAKQMFNREKIPLGRHVTPEEVADAVMFLLGSAAGGMTGSCVMVDGGMSA